MIFVTKIFFKKYKYKNPDKHFTGMSFTVKLGMRAFPTTYKNIGINRENVNQSLKIRIFTWYGVCVCDAIDYLVIT